ncbi:MAG: Holliday junction branch migration protein RuvA [Candidatus Berkiella sp.]
MIGQLRGKLIEKNPPFLLIDVHGVGYIVQTPLSTFFVLPEVGQDVVLRTHMVVREDAQLLYGFATHDECYLFQELIKTNGVGPKIALAILSGLSPQELMEIVATEEVSRLQRLPGIGAKTALRIIVEMKDRLSKMLLSSPQKTRVSSLTQEQTPREEAIAALMALGYKPQEATKALAKVKNDSLSCEAMLKEALQGLAKV